METDKKIIMNELKQESQIEILALQCIPATKNTGDNFQWRIVMINNGPTLPIETFLVLDLVNPANPEQFFGWENTLEEAWPTGDTLTLITDPREIPVEASGQSFDGTVSVYTDSSKTIRIATESCPGLLNVSEAQPVEVTISTISVI